MRPRLRHTITILFPWVSLPVDAFDYDTQTQRRIYLGEEDTLEISYVLLALCFLVGLWMQQEEELEYWT
jgi:hypothetical protein